MVFRNAAGVKENHSCPISNGARRNEDRRTTIILYYISGDHPDTKLDILLRSKLFSIPKKPYITFVIHISISKLTINSM